jgi:hypothetical protein
MANNPSRRQDPKPKRSVIRWLLNSDPSVRWQVMRDLTGAPAEEVAAERATARPPRGRRPVGRRGVSSHKSPANPPQTRPLPENPPPTHCK